MPMPYRLPMLAAIAVPALVSLVATTTPTRAQNVLEQAAEHRFQLDFHVQDAALQRMLPPGWETAILAQGPAKDANLRMIFIDRYAVVGADGKPAAKPTSRLVYLAIPVKQAGANAAGQMIVHGLTENVADAPGSFGVFQHAAQSAMQREFTAKNGVMTGSETWSFKASTGEFMEVAVKYERGPAVRGGGEVKFFDPKDPAKFQIYKTEQAIDIMRNVTTNPPDRVKVFSYKAGGGRIATLFDGTEKVLSWDSFPWYVRTIIAP